MSLTLLCQIFLPIIGLAGPLLILLGLPGTWLLLSLVGLAEWITEPRLFGTPVLVTAVALAVAGEVCFHHFWLGTACSFGDSAAQSQHHQQPEMAFSHRPQKTHSNLSDS